MTDRHEMVLVHRNGTEMVFLCEQDGCGRRLMIDPVKARLVVIDQGDPYVAHRGGTGHVHLDARVGLDTPVDDWTPASN